MEGRTRITPVGIVLFVLLAAGALAAIVGSKTLQTIGFVAVVIVLLALVGDQLPRMRIGGGHALGGMPRARPPRRPGSARRGSSRRDDGPHLPGE
jgi:hypothetical protein